MKSLFRFITAFLLLSAFFCAQAQKAADTNMMYLVKGDRVVTKYKVNEVDYVCFSLPDSVIDAAFYISIDETGKNHLTYSVTTDNPTRAYAHGIVSRYDVEYLALDNFGETLENISEENLVLILQACLPYVAYFGIGSQAFEMRDWEEDGTGSRFSVQPGTPYYVCVWEVDPTTQAPLDNFVYAETRTMDPGQSQAALNVSFKRQNERGMAFDIQGDDDILYIMTSFGLKETMDSYVASFGLDYLLGMFGQTFTIADLQGGSEVDENIEAATWPINGAGEYVLYVRGFDAKGDIVDARCYASAETEGPEIEIIERSKAEGSVSISFEITPKNVSKAYIRLLKEDDFDDLRNAGHTIHELASGSEATDIVSTINSEGKYTYTNNTLGEAWYVILIYAEEENGKCTIFRTSFWPESEAGSRWADYDPVHKSPLKALHKRMLSKSRKPCIERLK